MIKSGFTIIEFLFVIVIVGLLSAIALPRLSKDYHILDAKYLELTIKEKQQNGIMYSHWKENISWRNYINNDLYNNTCIDLNINAQRSSFGKSIIDIEESLKIKPYFINNDTIITVIGLTNTNNRICFNDVGVPYDGDYNIENKIRSIITINVENNNKIISLKILPNIGTILK